MITMGDADPFEFLESLSSAERLKGARLVLNQDLTGLERQRLQQLRSKESDGWVQSALDRVLAKGAANPRRSDSTPDKTDDSQDLDDVRAQAIMTVAQVLLHELNPLIGDVEEAAAEDVTDYEHSETERELRRVKDLLRTISRYETAAHAPRYVEFDLTDAVGRELRHARSSQVKLRTGRSDPVVTSGDWEQLRLAFVNGLRNAIEASADDQQPVVVNWGVTDKDAWISVLDEGVGLPPGFDAAYDAGTTTKSKETNQGWGLAIALRAIESHRGRLQLRPRTPRGTVFTMRWPTRGDDGRSTD